VINSLFMGRNARKCDEMQATETCFLTARTDVKWRCFFQILAMHLHKDVFEEFVFFLIIVSICRFYFVVLLLIRNFALEICQHYRKY